MRRILLLLPLTLLFAPAFASATTIYLTSGSTWTVPNDWNNSANTIEVIGGGGGGTSGSSGGNGGPASGHEPPVYGGPGGDGGNGGGGGGAGAYSKASNVTLTPGSSVGLSVGSGGSGTGGDTYLCNSTSNCSSIAGSAVKAGAKGGGGASGSSGGSGGQAASGVGSVKSSGGGGSSGGSGDPASIGPPTSSYPAGICDGTNGGSGGTGGNGGNGGGGGGAAGKNGAGGAGYGASGGVGDNGTTAAGGNGTEFQSSPAYGSGGGGAGVTPIDDGRGSGQGYGGTFMQAGNTGGNGSGGGTYGAGGGGGGGGGGGAGEYTYPAGDGQCNGWGNWGGGGSGGSGVAGTQGLIVITYTPTAPSCSITFGANPLTYGDTTSLTWSSSNNTSMYINSIGYVAASGSTTVGPLAATDYSCSAGNGVSTTTTSAILNVGPHSTISQSTTSTSPSTSYNITWTSSNASSCSIYAKAPGVATSTQWTATSGTQATTSAITGTYYWQAECTGSGLTSNSYLTHTVSDPTPTCSVGVSPSSVVSGNSSTLTWSSTNASSLSIAPLGSVGLSGSTSISPATTTTYNGTATGAGGTGTCTISLTVTCTPTTAYTCSDSQHIASTTTRADCSVVSNTTSCAAPSFCSSGSAVCLDPTPTFNQSSGNSGHLQAHPQIVPNSHTTKLFWNVGNVSSCSVSGNGETFSGVASSNGGETTAAINQQTAYTLSCTKLDDTTFSESIIVSIIPTFQER